MSPPPSATDARWRDPEPSETARARTSGENLFVVLLVMAPSSQELEPPANPGRFISSPVIACCTVRVKRRADHSQDRRSPDTWSSNREGHSHEESTAQRNSARPPMQRDDQDGSACSLIKECFRRRDCCLAYFAPESTDGRSGGGRGHRTTCVASICAACSAGPTRSALACSLRQDLRRR